MKWLFRAFVAAASILATTQDSVAQVPRAQRLRQQGDTMAAIAAALSAQLEFERVRLQFMPYGSAGSGGQCDEIIGRFCYTFGDRSGKSYPAPAEMDAVKSARTRLLGKLDSLVGSAGANPGDWLTGTLIRYRVEAGQTDAALRTLDYCGASPWWCSALRGMVYHTASRHDEAYRAFSDARAQMDTYILCEWENVVQMLSDDDARQYKTILCDDRIDLARTAWWLADPLYLQPGNDRRSEHDTRRVMERLNERGMNPTWLRWDDDMAEIVMRFGWPDYWRRYWSSMGDPNATSPRISQFTLEPSYHFLPSLQAMLAPAKASQSDWELLPRYSREEYSPDSLMFGTMSSQSARFLRGDSLLLVTRASVADDSILRAEESLNVALITARSASDSAVIVTQRMGQDEFTLQSRMTNEGRVASLEVLTESNLAARTRFGVAPVIRNRTSQAISDMLLFRGAPPSDEVTLDAVVDSMHSSLQLTQDAPLGIFWEIYGLREGDEIAVTLTAIPDERGFLHRLGQALRIVNKPSSVSLSWREMRNRDGSVVAQSLQLDLANMRPGGHLLRLSASINGGEAMVTERRITVREKE